MFEETFIGTRESRSQEVPALRSDPPAATLPQLEEMLLDLLLGDPSGQEHFDHLVLTDEKWKPVGSESILGHCVQVDHTLTPQRVEPPLALDSRRVQSRPGLDPGVRPTGQPQR